MRGGEKPRRPEQMANRTAVLEIPSANVYWIPFMYQEMGDTGSTKKD